MIDSIKTRIRIGDFTFTDHALRQMLMRNISDSEVIEAVLNGEIIEDYPSDKYGPSCLIYGRTLGGRILHVHCCRLPRVKIITTYEPDVQEWINGRIRRPK